MSVNIPTRYPQLLHSRFWFKFVHFPARRHPILARNASGDASLTDKRLAIFPKGLQSRTAETLALARLPIASIFRGMLLDAFLLLVHPVHARVRALEEDCQFAESRAEPG